MRFRTPGRLVRRALLVVFLLVVSVGLGYGYHVYDDNSCGTGVQWESSPHECVGVTDGGMSFDPALDQVFARIKAENDRVTKSGAPYATIALMIPMYFPRLTAPVDRKHALWEVQGAYFAQYRANHKANGRAPAIRMVLANPGLGGGHWRSVADRLARMAASPDHRLRAVFGFDISLPTTQRSIDYLTNVKHIPVVGGALTADDIANTPQHPHAYEGLVRVNPSNTDQAAALAHADHGVPVRQTVLVEDARNDDNYITSLRKVFEARTEGASLAPEQFRSPSDITTEGTTSNDFRQIIANICASPAKEIYFAGRPVQLRQFLNELGNRGCRAHTYTVITGPAANALPLDGALEWDTLRHGVTLRLTASSHPDAWTGPDTPDTGGSAEAFKTLKDLTNPQLTGPVGPVDLTDSRAIITYDSAWTAIEGIRDEAVHGHTVPSADEVRNAWLRLHGAHRVEGASGWICLDNQGNPYDKAVAVVRLDPTTRTGHFVTLSWPTGRPPNGSCTAPRTPAT
jgi:ABC-type branched-subunit amino acid transport system substrate-binding protein